VYRAGPPGGTGDAGPLTLSGAARRVFEGCSAAARDPALSVYLSDLVAPHGLALRRDLLDQGAGHSYGEMGGELLAEAVPADQPVDLLVLAFAVHDVIPGRSTAAHLSYLCPGHPTAFAVCDQGSAAPFTGLRLIREYAATAGCQRALLVIVEQAALPYELAAPAALPARHAAVTVLCGEPGAPGAAQLDSVRQHAGVSPAQAGDLLAAQIAALCAGRGDVTLVLGNGLTRQRAAVPVDIPAVDQVLIAPAGQPVTGVWWELAGGLPGWSASGRRVLLADYEPELRYLCVSAIDVESGLAAPAARFAGRQAQ
jgi:hypothetical protein